MDREATVFVIDRNDAWRDSITNTLQLSGFKVSQYDSAESFLENLSPDQHGCVVLDVDLPGMNGLDLQEALIQRDTYPHIVFVSENADITASVKAMKAGAIDFLQKPFQDVELLARVQEAIDRNRHQRLQYMKTCYVNDRIESLTRREKEVMDLVLEGLTNKEIANRLGLSHRTVELHRSRVMAKMKAQSIVDLVKMTSVSIGHH